MGQCASREEKDDVRQRLSELEAQVQMYRTRAEHLDEQNKQLAKIRRRGSMERAELQKETAALGEQAEQLAGRYGHSLALKVRGAVEQAGLAQKAVLLGRVNERVERGKAFAVETLGPLHSRIKEGDAQSLEHAIVTLTPRVEGMKAEESLGVDHLTTIVASFFEGAVVKSRGWREVLATMRVVIETTQAGNISRRDIKRLFAAVKEASITGLSIHKSDPELTQKIEQAFVDYFVSEGAHGNRIQRELVRRFCASSHLLDFDFTDLSLCVSLVDLAETLSNEFFLTRAAAVIESHKVKDFRSVLMSLDTIIFFLRFLDQEDLALTYKMYRSMQPDPRIMPYISAAEGNYGPGCELVKTAGLNLHSEKAVLSIIEQLRCFAPSINGPLSGLRCIFHSWAQIMREEFGILVLPHHTQIVCMLIFLQFIESPKPSSAGALIAEMGTGEGKSAVIATLALYCVVFLGRRVHVVVDDQSLVERDFQTFRGLFGMFQAQTGVALQARLCVGEARKRAQFAGDEGAAAYVEEAADIVYCEAKHLSSFYTRFAKQGGKDFKEIYRDRVLILDEVDALVISEEPNAAFVYENEALSAFATRVAEELVRQAPPEQIAALANTAESRRVLRQMERAAQVANRWVQHVDYTFDKDAGRHVRVQDGRANDAAWSLALECKNYADNLSKRIVYNERLFVMSRPNVFRKYGNIIGLSGSVGNDTERDFLRTVYRAHFFKVPKFLSTCRGSLCNSPEQRGVFIEEAEDAQWHTTCDKAFSARETTPVLIIAKDRQAAARLAQELRFVASAKGLSAKDLICTLSRDLYESQPAQFKEHLFQCTQPVGKGSSKSFRIAVTDPRGGRGVDYRVSDPDADRAGGLTLIINYIPKCSRDWIQFLGRTARQDKRGQWLAVLNRQDYEADVQKFGQALKAETAVETILSWGNAEAKMRLQEIHGQYHRGLRANELSEEVAKRHLHSSPQGRQVMVQLCSEYAQLSLSQIDKLAANVPGLSPSLLPTEALEVGPDTRAKHRILSARSIAFLIDRSSSMLSRDAGEKVRFDVCRECIMSIMDEHIGDDDRLSLCTFDSEVRETFPLMEKGPNKEQIAALIRGVPAPSGLTRLYDGILHALHGLEKSGAGPKFLVTLTDGDDNMSQQQPNGERVSAMLHAGIPGLNLIFVTCGRDVNPRTLELVRYWAQLAKWAGNVGAHITAHDPSQLRDAFAAVAELMDAPDGELEV